MTGMQTTPDRITHLARAFRASKVLLSAVELGVFTALANGPQDLETLRREVGISQRGARDFFDALVSLGLLDRDETGRYRNGAEADLYLDREKASYIGGELDHYNIRGYLHWHMLTEALKTGKPQSLASGGGYFSKLYADAQSLEIFARGMTGGTLSAALALATKFPWSKFNTLIDIGTSQGCLPVQIARAHAHITGGGFDLPPMCSHFERYVEAQGLSGRLQFHAGDFLADPLPGADVLVLGRVLHNWDLAAKMMLLKKAYDALPTGGALIVYERMIDAARRANAASLLASLNMLIMTAGGFEYTEADLIGWMRGAGFRDMRGEPLTTDLSMVVGTK
jgi:hypothetical protein